MATEILNLIKNRKTIRKYKKIPISQETINSIVNGGIWASSLHGFQPWRFIIVRDKKIINKIAKILYKKSKVMTTGGNIILHSSSKTIMNSQILIVIYNSGAFTQWAARFRKEYIKTAKISELSAISAAIQNMVLVAQEQGVGSCWLGAPLFCAEEINKLFKTKDELVAILTLGYPRETGRRSLRKPLSQTLFYL
jgi:nitroreductase